ncbi:MULTISPECIES: hypothetical protein [unclassified Bradyrhizobium]|uniref:hypothetical protein n=1 Tax=unclassified Bradyrhizobium TaxID=2631580 RepID=UPI0028E403D9|nr:MULTISPECIES: hypothetical protein [unclassified Bradyrhizobium]
MTTKAKTSTEHMLNHAPGFRCPACNKASIQLSLDQFLGSNEVVCPICATKFNMDKSQCTQLVDMLKRLQVAQRNVNMLAKRNC